MLRTFYSARGQKCYPTRTESHWKYSLSSMLFPRTLHAVAATPSDAFQRFDHSGHVGHRAEAVRFPDVVEVQIHGQPRQRPTTPDRARSGPALESMELNDECRQTSRKGQRVGSDGAHRSPR